MKTRLSDSPVETLLKEGLPPPNTRRWVVRRKAAVVMAVNTGIITIEQACQIYQLTEEEFLSWKHTFETHGFAGLRTTRIQQYRRPRSRVPSRFVLEFDWRGLRLDEDTWLGSKVNRLIGEFVGQALPSVHFAHRDLT
jgi:Protein of unknown function (DUF1153)